MGLIKRAVGGLWNGVKSAGSAIIGVVGGGSPTMATPGGWGPPSTSPPLSVATPPASSSGSGGWLGDLSDWIADQIGRVQDAVTGGRGDPVETGGGGLAEPSVPGGGSRVPDTVHTLPASGGIGGLAVVAGLVYLWMSR